MDKDSALRKIRALLNRSGRTDQEIDTAQMLAAVLADRAGIDLDSVDLSDPSRPAPVLVHREIAKWAGRRPVEAMYAGQILDEYFEVSTLTACGWYGEQVLVIGYPHHVDVAEYVFGFLVAEFRRVWNRRTSRTKARKAFMWGAYCALDAKLRARFGRPYATGASLSPVASAEAARTKYIHDHFGPTKASSIAPQSSRAVASRAGWRDGQGIDIRPGIDATPDSSGRLGLGPAGVGRPALPPCR